MSKDLVLWQDTVDTTYYGLGVQESFSGKKPHYTKLVDLYEDLLDEVLGYDVRRAVEGASKKIIKVRITCEILED